MPERKSLYRSAAEEAHSFRARRAGEEGRDPGREAIREWNRERFWAWCGERLREHLRGEEFWEEFGEEYFDLLRRPGSPLAPEERAALEGPARGADRLEGILRRLEAQVSETAVEAVCSRCGRRFFLPRGEAPAPPPVCPACRA